MITFYDELAKVIEPHGVSADRLNKDLVALLCQVYKRGIRFGAYIAIGKEEDPAYLEILESSLKMWNEKVDKEKRGMES